MRKFAVTASLCFALSTFATTANAGQLIDVGVGNSIAKGAGVVGTSNDKWNDLGPGSLTANSLIDSNGNTTGVSAAIVADNGGGGFGNTSPNTTITQSYDWTASGTPISVTLTGLAPHGFYDVYTYGVTDPCCDDQRQGTVTAAAANGGASQIDTGDTTLTKWVSGANYVLLPVEADSAGTVEFSVTRINNEADLNGFQVQAVPEPKSLVAIIGAGAVGLLAAQRARRRKKRTS